MKIKSVSLIILVVFLFSCQSRPVTPGKEKPPYQHTVSFIAVGDNLFHETIIRAALTEDGSYDFSPIYTEVKHIVQKADLAFINQETVMAGTSFGYSGYPQFNTPQSLGRTLADTGFDIVNLANNHAMDKGRSGLYATLDFLDTIRQFTVIGARKEGESARIITKNHIKLGFLSYTFSLNGIPLPADNPNLVSMIDREKMTEEIKALRPACDFLIVSMHWGAEYLLEPDKSQTDLALFLTEQNVDLILGHHPHVLQRFEELPRPDGKKTLCFFSLGNFASNQRERERIIGAMVFLVFAKNPTGTTIQAVESALLRPIGSGRSEFTSGEYVIFNFGILPIITHYDRNFRNTKLYPLYAYTEELINSHRLKNEGPGLSFEFFKGVTDRLNTNIITHDPFNEDFHRLLKLIPSLYASPL